MGTDEHFTGTFYIKRRLVENEAGTGGWAGIAEVFGTTGEAYAEPSHGAGVRWESRSVVLAATFGDSFNGDGSPRFEFGPLFFNW